MKNSGESAAAEEVTKDENAWATIGGPSCAWTRSSSFRLTSLFPEFGVQHAIKRCISRCLRLSGVACFTRAARVTVEENSHACPKKRTQREGRNEVVKEMAQKSSKDSAVN